MAIYASGMKRKSTMADRGLVKRVKTLEYKAYRNRPEMMTVTSSGSGALVNDSVSNVNITQVTQGTAVNDRVGDKIRVFRIECRGYVNPRLDILLLQGKAGDLPSLADFSTAPGCYVVDEANTTKFTEWLHYRNFNGATAATGSAPVKFSKSFKGGLLVKYNGSGSNPVSDSLHVTLVNRSGVTCEFDLSVRMWYTDV